MPRGNHGALILKKWSLLSLLDFLRTSHSPRSPRPQYAVSSHLCTVLVSDHSKPSNRPMPAIAITGSIGSGKSTVLQRLADYFGLDARVISVTSYSADEENRRLLNNDPEVRRLITSALGISCYEPSGKADRGYLFRLIGADPAAKKTLEGILHPRLESIWKPMAASHRESRDAFFLAETSTSSAR